MSAKMFRCPNCKADGGDVGVFGAYFTIYECSSCEERFCHKCPSSDIGKSLCTLRQEGLLQGGG